jgi:hypothetical protein
MRNSSEPLLAAFGGREGELPHERVYPSPLRRMVYGALAGTVATLPMTAAMLLIYRQLGPEERAPLPPALLAGEASEAVLRRRPGRALHTTLSLVAHFAYGAAVGAVGGPLTRRMPVPGPLAGAAVGLGVWAMSYIVAMPSLGLLPPSGERPAGRRALLLTAHLVWGATLGAVMEALEPAQVEAPGTTERSHQNGAKEPRHAV